jgi:hypothetical protein
VNGQGLGQDIGLNDHATCGGLARVGAVDDFTAGFGACVDRVTGSTGAFCGANPKNSFRFTAIVNARNDFLAKVTPFLKIDAGVIRHAQLEGLILSGLRLI